MRPPVNIRFSILPVSVLVTLGGWLASPGSAAAQAEPAPVRPGDVVKLSLWREPDLSGEFPVNQYGTVILPMVGEYDVTGETDRSLRERVIRDLRQTVVNPSIELVVLKRVRVLGAVREPGIYHLDPTMTVADALAAAGGSGPDAKAGTVVLRRDGEVVSSNLRVETLVADALIRSGDELHVPERGWMDRHFASLVGAGVAAAGILVSILVR